MFCLFCLFKKQFVKTEVRFIKCSTTYSSCEAELPWGQNFSLKKWKKFLQKLLQKWLQKWLQNFYFNTNNFAIVSTTSIRLSIQLWGWGELENWSPLRVYLNLRTDIRSHSQKNTSREIVSFEVLLSVTGLRLNDFRGEKRDIFCVMCISKSRMVVNLWRHTFWAI